MDFLCPLAGASPLLFSNLTRVGLRFCVSDEDKDDTADLSRLKYLEKLVKLVIDGPTKEYYWRDKGMLTAKQVAQIDQLHNLTSLTLRIGTQPSSLLFCRFPLCSRFLVLVLS